MMTEKFFWKKYHKSILCVVIFVFLLHGAKLYSEIIGIDTEDMIHLQKDFYNGWLTTGRHGLVFFKQLTDTMCFQPYFAGLMTLLFMVLAISAFVVLWSSISGKKHWGLIAGAFLWISHPILTEQLYFSLQSVEICAGIFLTAMALYLTMCFAGKHKWYFCAAAVLLLLITFAMYQVFVPFYVFGTTTILLLTLLRDWEENQIYGAKVLLGRMVPYIAVFLIAFLGNTLITGVCFGQSSYLGKQIMWGKASFVDCIHGIAAHVCKTLIGYDGIYYHFSYGILVLIAMGLGTAYILSGKGTGNKPVALFYLLSVLIAPYLLVLVCGSATVIRAQLILPAATGFLAYLDSCLLGMLLHKHKETKQRSSSIVLAVTGALLCLAIVTGGWHQTYTTMGLYYTEQCRYAQDEALGRALILKIDEVRGEEDYPLVFIGSKPFEANNSNIMGETIGKSFFDYDAEVEPTYFWSTKRILGFLHTLGREYPQLASDKMSEAQAISQRMPQWPADGSVQVAEDMVIVKLEVE